MKIVAWINKGSAPAYHRITVPLLTMPDTDVFITNSLDEQHFEGCDIFMYNRVIPDQHLPKIKELKQKFGFKICVDVDDHWLLDEHHILYAHYKENNFAQRQIDQLKQADIVLTTHARLAEEVKKVNKNVHVCPNAIPHRGQFDIKPVPYEFVRLFWQGSITHKQDIRILERPIGVLGGISGKIKMVMAGYTESEDEWYEMAMMYTAHTKHQYKLLPGLPVTNYYEHYKHADICLIPLVNSWFNRHKSNLKVLEAANLGLPVIASKVNPYLDMPVLYCSCSADWIAHIKRLVANKSARVEAGGKLREFCDRNFNFEKINKERKQILEHQLSVA